MEKKYTCPLHILQRTFCMLATHHQVSWNGQECFTTQWQRTSMCSISANIRSFSICLAFERRKYETSEDTPNLHLQAAVVVYTIQHQFISLPSTMILFCSSTIFLQPTKIVLNFGNKVVVKIIYSDAYVMN